MALCATFWNVASQICVSMLSLCEFVTELGLTLLLVKQQVKQRTETENPGVETSLPTGCNKNRVLKHLLADWIRKFHPLKLKQLQ